MLILIYFIHDHSRPHLDGNRDFVEIDKILGNRKEEKEKRLEDK